MSFKFPGFSAFPLICFLLLSLTMPAFSYGDRIFDFQHESGIRNSSSYGRDVELKIHPEGLKIKFCDSSQHSWLRKGIILKLNPSISWDSFDSVSLELDHLADITATGIQFIDRNSNFYSALGKKAEKTVVFQKKEILYRYNEKQLKESQPGEWPLKTMIIYVEIARPNQGKTYEFLLKKAIFQKDSVTDIDWKDPAWNLIRNQSLPSPRWEQTAAPGDGGTSWYLKIHPSDDKILVQSCDMGGNYMTWNASKSYSSINDPDWTFPRIAYVSAADFCLARPEIGYIGTEGNGLFKTTDKGRTWQPLNTVALEQKFHWRYPRIPISALTVNPSNPDEIWAGIGYPRRLEYRGSGKRRLPQGLIHSTDGGRTWKHLSDAFPKSEMALSIMYFQSHPGLLAIGTDGGVYISENSGRTFQSISQGLPLPSYFGGFDGIVNPRTGEPVIVVAMEAEYHVKNAETFSTGGIWRYLWKKQKWQECTGNLRIPIEKITSLPDLKSGFAPNPYWIAARKKLWRDFLNEPENQKLYQNTVFDADNSAGAFFKKWNEQRKDHHVATAMKPFRQSLRHFLPDFHTVKIDPRNPDVIYASIFQAQIPYGLWKTSDGGRHWHQICRGARAWQDPDWQEYVPKGEPAMNMIQSWTRRQPMNYGTERLRMGFWEIRKFDLSRSNPDVLYLHSHRITYRSENGGRTWTDASNRMIDQKQARFSGLGNSNICVFGLQFFPKDPQKLLLYMADSGIKVSTDGGKSIFALENTMFGSNQWVESAAFDPANSNRFYVLFQCADWIVGGIKGSYFLETRDFGKTFLNLNNPENGPLQLPPRQKAFTNRMGNLMIDPLSPENSRRMLATHANINRHILYANYYWNNTEKKPAEGILETLDGGRTWHPSNQGMEDFREVVDLHTPDQMQTLYAAVASHRKVPGKGGLYRSIDRGKSWKRIPVPCDSIAQVTSSQGNLYIAGGILPTEDDMKNRGGIWKSTDHGKSWQKLLGAPLVNNLAVNPDNSNYLYCTIEDGKHGSLIPCIGIYRSADGGKSWNRINRGIAFPWAFMRFVWHPQRHNELWLATYGSGCYKLVDNIQ